MRDRLRRGRVVVRNRHALHWEGEEQVARRRSVDKRGVRSDEAWIRDVLGDMAKARDLLVVNDEAHHAWRVPERAGSGSGFGLGADADAVRIAGIDKAEIEEGDQVGWAASTASPGRAASCAATTSPRPPSPRPAAGRARRGAVRLDRERLRPERRHRGGSRQDPAGGRAGRRHARCRHLEVAPVPHLQRPGGQGRPEPPGRPGAEEPLPDLVLNGYYLLGYDWRETARDGPPRGSRPHR